MNKKQLKLVIGSFIYISILGISIPILISSFGLYNMIYDYFEELALMGVFFFMFLIGSIFFFPFLYSTLVKEKLSLNIERSKKNQKNPRSYSLVLLLIGLPILIWLIFGNLGYYSITRVRSGLGEFALNGFLVWLFILIYFFICPAIVLGLKKNRFQINESGYP